MINTSDGTSGLARQVNGRAAVHVIAGQLAAAVEAGGADDDGAVLEHRQLRLDDKALAQLAVECQRLLDRASRLAAQADKRLGKDDAAARSATLAVFALQAPRLADQIPASRRSADRPLMATTRRRGNGVRDKVLTKLRKGPSTVYELAQGTGLAPQQVRPAVHALMKTGQVTQLAERRAMPGRKGPHSAVYAVAD